MKIFFKFYFIVLVVSFLFLFGVCSINLSISKMELSSFVLIEVIIKNLLGVVIFLKVFEKIVIFDFGAVDIICVLGFEKNIVGMFIKIVLIYFKDLVGKVKNVGFMVELDLEVFAVFELDLIIVLLCI